MNPEEKHKVLDKGFVRLVDHMGNDDRIVQAARVSYGAGTKTSREDAALIDYLLRNAHTSPFEQVVLTFHVKTPIFVARQWVRHRTARMNEISGRYSIMTDDFYVPEPQNISEQSSDNKQGRDTRPMSQEKSAAIIESIKNVNSHAYQEYQKLLETGIAREIARIILPLNLYTEMYWQMDLHNLFHFLRLRLHEHAQYEIREYARVIKDITAKICPIAVQSFENHIQGSNTFSAVESQALSNLLKGEPHGLEGRQARQLEEKLSRLNGE